MTKDQVKQLIEDAAGEQGGSGAEWYEGGPETYEFWNKNDIGTSGTATVYADGYVRLEMLVPAEVAGRLIEIVTAEPALPVIDFEDDTKAHVEDWTPFKAQPKVEPAFATAAAIGFASGEGMADELKRLIAEQQQDMESE